MKKVALYMKIMSCSNYPHGQFHTYSMVTWQGGFYAIAVSLPHGCFTSELNIKIVAMVTSSLLSSDLSTDL